MKWGFIVEGLCHIPRDRFIALGLKVWQIFNISLRPKISATVLNKASHIDVGGALVYTGTGSASGELLGFGIILRIDKL